MTNIWIEYTNLELLKKKYPVGCKIEVQWEVGKTYKGIVKKHAMFGKKAYLVLEIGRYHAIHLTELALQKTFKSKD